MGWERCRGEEEEEVRFEAKERLRERVECSESFKVRAGTESGGERERVTESERQRVRDRE